MEFLRMCRRASAHVVRIALARGAVEQGSVAIVFAIGILRPIAVRPERAGLADLALGLIRREGCGRLLGTLLRILLHLLKERSGDRMIDPRPARADFRLEDIGCDPDSQ